MGERWRERHPELCAGFASILSCAAKILRRFKDGKGTKAIGEVRHGAP